MRREMRRVECVYLDPGRLGTKAVYQDWKLLPGWSRGRVK